MHTLHYFLVPSTLLTPLRFDQLKSCYYGGGSPANCFPCDPVVDVRTYRGGGEYRAGKYHGINGVGSCVVGSCTDTTCQILALSPPTRFVLRALVVVPCPRISLGLVLQTRTPVVSSNYALSMTNRYDGTFSLDPDRQNLFVRRTMS